MKPLTVTHKEWRRIRESIQREHGASMVLIREKMRRELGFLPREHVKWEDDTYKSEFVIDFFTEEARTWFLLKYT